MKKIVFAGSVLLLLALGIFLWNVNENERRESAYADAWEKERRPLEVKKQKLEQELEKLNKEYQNLILPKGTTQFLFAELDPKVYSACYPLMKKMGYTGTLILSEEQFPGKEGCITTEEFSVLIQEGWQVCVKWENERNVSQWWPALRTAMGQLNVSNVQTVYFPKGTHREELDKQVKSLGFSIAFCEKEDMESPLQKDVEDGLWHIGVMGIMTEQPKIWLVEAVANDANVAFVIGFSQKHQLYNAGTFERMLKAVQEYELSGDLLVYDILKTRDYYDTRNHGVSAEVEEQYQQDKTQLETEIAEVKLQLTEIDKKYQ